MQEVWLHWACAPYYRNISMSDLNFLKKLPLCIMMRFFILLWLHRQEEVAYVAMGMGMGVGLEDYDSPALVGVDGIQQPVSSSVSADSAEQTSGVDSPNFNPEATLLYSHAHAGTCTCR